jgi:DNA primase
MKNTQFDFRYLKTHVSIDHILAVYGLDRQLKRKSHCLVGPCPLHQGDNPTAFHVHLQKGLWRCFTACGSGDIVELVRRIENCTYAEAARHLRRLADNTKPSSTSVFAPYTSCNPLFSPFVYHIPLIPNVAFLQKVKKISVSTALHYEAGVTTKSAFLRGTVAVRLHDLSGNPLVYCGRRLHHDAILQKGKWCFPKNFPKSKILYNAHRALPLTKKGIIVVECPWAVMRFAQAGINNAVALLGTSISPTQATWITKAPAVLLMLDGDKSGQKATSLIANILRLKTNVRIHLLDNNMEPEDLTDSELQSIALNFLLSF